MGVFNEGGFATESPKSARMVGECKRDYEAEIEKSRCSQKTTSDLINSVEEYIEVNGRGGRSFTLAELYGSLILEMRSQNKTIAELQGLWEQEK